MTEGQPAGERVTMVKFYKGRVSVHRVGANLSTDEERNLDNCRDQPSDEFKQAFVQLIPLALGLLEIGGKRWIGNAVVSQVKIGVDKDKRANFVLTVIKPYDHGAAVINTPVRMERFEEETGPQYASDDLTKAVARVCIGALVYANGERTVAQAELELPEGREGEEQTGDDPEGAPAEAGELVGAGAEG